MKYSFVAVATLAAGVLAQPEFQNSNFDVTSGQPFTIKLGGCEEGCTLILQNGPSDDTKDVKVLSDNAGAEFVFTPSGLPTDTYNFKVVDKKGAINYSKQFEYEGTGPAPTSETSTTAAPSTSEAASTEEATSTEEESTTEAETLVPTPTSTVEASTPVPTTPAGNSTTLSTKTAGASSTGVEEVSSTEPASTATTVPDSGAARMTSSAALIAGIFAAMAYFA